MKTEQLDAWLQEQGWRELEALDEVTRWLLDSAYVKGRQANLALFARRGWAVHFDAEGDFYEDGAYSGEIGALLHAAGISAQVEDSVLAGVGRMFTVRLEGHEVVALWKMDDTNDLSDWADLEPIVAVAQRAAELAGNGFRFFSAKTDDQTALLLALPQAVAQLHGEAPLFAEQKLRRKPRFLDPKTARERLREQRLDDAIEVMRSQQWRGQRQTCSPEIVALLRTGCARSRKLLLAAADAADRFVVDWAFDTAAQLYGSRPANEAELRRVLE